MKRKASWKGAGIGFSIFLLLAMPFCSMAQEVRVTPTSNTANACGTAERDAEADVNDMLWMGAGCLFGILGVGAGYLIVPSPSATRLLGKSPDYVAIYTDCYKRKGRSVQTNKAIIGCVVSGVAYIVYMIVVIVMISEATDLDVN